MNALVKKTWQSMTETLSKMLSYVSSLGDIFMSPTVLSVSYGFSQLSQHLVQSQPDACVCGVSAESLAG